MASPSPCVLESGVSSTFCLISGAELCELKHRHIVRAADWSPDSTHVMTGGKEAKLRLFDLSHVGAEPEMFTGVSSTFCLIKWRLLHVFVLKSGLHL